MKVLGMICLLLFLNEATSIGQNLVTNASFEKVNRLDEKWSGSYKDFNAKIKNWKSPTQASPDLLFDQYLDLMKPERENLSFENILPRTGRLMVGIKTFGCENNNLHCKEYLQVELDRMAKKDGCFKYEFWVHPSQASIKSNNLGIALSDTLVEQFENVELLTMENYSKNQEIIDQFGWHKIEGEISPEKDSKYLLIGNFTSDASTKFNMPKVSTRYSYYLIDDVALYPLDCISKEIIKKNEFVLENVLFNFDSWELNSNGVKILQQYINKFNAEEVVSIQIIGHTDGVGEEAYNIELSEKRAQHVQQVFVENGFNSSKIEAIGQGSKNLIGDKKKFYKQTGRNSNQPINPSTHKPINPSTYKPSSQLNLISSLFLS